MDPAGKPARLLAFLRAPTTAGGFLLAASAAALLAANSPFSHAYEVFLQTPVSVGVAPYGFNLPGLNLPGLNLPGLNLPVHGWIDDGLMSLFFLLVSLEIRHELSHGHLHPWRRAVLPGIAAFGGMIVPAAIFFAITWHRRELHGGWAIPVATDIAFSLAVIAALGRRVPVEVKIFLTALAILDDLLAIIIIAVFYSAGLDLRALAAAITLAAMIWALGRAGLRHPAVFVVLGLPLWLLVLRSGVHPTLAGVALAAVIPGTAPAGQAHPPTVTIERIASIVVCVVVLPCFGFANGGLDFSQIPASAATSALTLGIFAGLVLGKPIGVFGATVAARALGVGVLPAGVSNRHLLGAALLCGIGYTMSLFIGNLAFSHAPFVGEIKLGVFAASLASAALGAAVLAGGARKGA